MYKFTITSTLLGKKYGYDRVFKANLNIRGNTYLLNGEVLCVNTDGDVIADIVPIVVNLRTGPETTQALDEVNGVAGVPIIEQIKGVAKVYFETAIQTGELVV
jgi:hypothetical protein